MEDKRKESGGRGLTRRQFVQATTAAAATSGAALDFVANADKALAYEGVSGYTISTTTCPYCSVGCGQRVVKRDSDGAVVDIYGDFESPFNNGGLCAKGAGAFQLANNPRRVGAWTFPRTYNGATMAAHPVNSVFAARAETGSGGGEDDFSAGVAYKRTGNGAWSQVGLTYALDQAAAGLVTARSHDSAGWDPGSGKYNSKSVAFFGSSHLNNEPNFVYRKLIAEFGTSNVEHQARI